MTARLLLAVPTGFLTAVFLGAVLVWIYNRYLPGLRESYVKKAISLSVLPAGVLAGIVAGAASFAGAAAAVVPAVPGLLCLLRKVHTARRRRLYDRGTTHEALPRTGTGLNRAGYPTPVWLALRAFDPVNEVDRLEVAAREQPIRGLHPDLDGLRLVLLTDFHVHPTLSGDYFRRTVREGLALEPDVLLIGGDFVSRSRWREWAAECLADIGRHPEIYAVRGNHDFWTGASFHARMIAGWKARLLSNEATVITRGAGRLVLVGLEDPYIPLTPRGERRLLRSIPSGLPRIGLVHTPSAFPTAQRLGCQFCLAGHTHGGQIRLPFFGTTIASCDMPERCVYGAGEWKGMATFVSNGLGAFYPMRHRCPPQIVQVTLRRAG